MPSADLRYQGCRSWILAETKGSRPRGYSVNQILPTMFALRDIPSSGSTGKIIGVMFSNVDDLLYGSCPGAEHQMKEILETFAVREENEGDSDFVAKR